jgi:hypothetical protein
MWRGGSFLGIETVSISPDIVSEQETMDLTIRVDNKTSTEAEIAFVNISGWAGQSPGGL